MQTKMAGAVGDNEKDKLMRKTQIVIFGLLLAAALNLASCETLVRAFADQAGRNIADALFNALSAD